MFNIIKKNEMVFYHIRVIIMFIDWFFLTSDRYKLPKKEIPILKETKFEIGDEWYDDNKKCQMIKAKYTFDGLNGIGYYEQQKLKAE